MNNGGEEESYCESEFDIYQEYNSNVGGSNDHDSVEDSIDNNNDNLGKPKHNSEIVVSKDGDNNSQMSQLFKRPSLTMKINRGSKKKSVTQKEAIRFRKQIESCFVHK